MLDYYQSSFVTGEPTQLRQADMKPLPGRGAKTATALVRRLKQLAQKAPLQSLPRPAQLKSWRREGLAK